MDERVEVSEDEVKKIIENMPQSLKDDFYRLHDPELECSETLESFVRRVAEFQANKHIPHPVIDSVDEEFQNISYTDLVGLLDGYDHDLTVSDPVPIEKIEKLAKLVGFTFPDSFKKYLSELGGIQQVNTSYAGVFKGDPIDGLMGITEYAREEYGLPEGYMALDYDTDLGWMHCLDLGQFEAGEYPVVTFYNYEERVGDVYAINFDIYFRYMISGMIGYYRKVESGELPEY